MEPEKRSIKPAVETYASDMADVLRDDKGGTIKKIIEGAEERESEKRRLSPESRQNKIFMIVSAFLVLAGLGAVLYVTENENIGTVETEPQFTPIVFTDKTAFVDATGFEREEILELLRNEMSAGELRTGAAKGIYLSLGKEVASLRRFNELLGLSFAPGEPELVYDNFLLGIVKTAEPEGSDGVSIFMLIRAQSTADIFGPLRGWEQKMLYDLRGLMNISTEGDRSYLLTKSFEDILVDNKNARALRDADGQIVIVYVFADNNSVVLADSVDAAREIMRRLAAKQTKE